MGIQGLMKLIGDYAPSAMKESDIKSYFGRKVAIDASMCLYQFLIAVRSDGSQLTDADGETTSHIIGLFYRTIRMLEAGIKPLYVFDGKPPDMKSHELEKRAEKRSEAEKELATAQEQGNADDVERFQKRLVKVTKKHTDDCKVLLKLMGVPYVEAPGEAEAQCAVLARAGKVYGTATEDMDCLTFGSTIQLRHLTASEAKKMPIKEINLTRLLSELDISQQEFIDLCILLGCDYCDSVKGVGPARAIALIKEHKSIEEIVKKGKKLIFPDNWMFEPARKLFVEPDVLDPETLSIKWTSPDEDGLVKFLVEEKGFREDRVRNGAKKLEKCRHGSTQHRLDAFFKPAASPTTATKRKGSACGPPKKKAKTAAGGSKFKRR